jgi:uncharacterized protein YgfB (UPF0149 family)
VAGGPTTGHQPHRQPGSRPERGGATNLIVGLLNLSSWLLISLAETQGEATDVELQERATNILRKLSQRLTEERFDLHATTEGGSGAE